MPRAQKQQLADDIVLNTGSLDDLFLQLIPLHQHYLTLAKHG
ncbi:MAG: dephospho-CoA kinase, partial [Acinetobacter sp.]